MYALLDAARTVVLDVVARDIEVGLPCVDVSHVAGVARGWLAGVDGGFSAPPMPVAPPPSAADLLARAASARYAVETGGITLNGVAIATDLASQTRIANAYAYLQASGAASVKFKATSGWIELSADQVKAMALAVGAHVQACFAAEDAADAAITADPPTVKTFAQVDAVFAALASAA